MTKQGWVNIHIRNTEQLIIEIFRYLKSLSPPLTNEIFIFRNIPYPIRNPKDLGCQLLKTVYCGLETITYKGPQLWQLLPEKIKSSSSLVNFKQNITLRRDPKCLYRVFKTYIGGRVLYKKAMQSQFTLFFSDTFFVDVN